MNTCIFCSKCVNEYEWKEEEEEVELLVLNIGILLFTTKARVAGDDIFQKKREQIVRILFLSLWLSTTSFTQSHCYPSYSLPYDIPTYWNFPLFLVCQFSFLSWRIIVYTTHYTLHNKQLISKCISMCFLTFAYSQFLIVMSASSAHQTKKRWRIETYGTTNTKRAKTKQ